METLKPGTRCQARGGYADNHATEEQGQCRNDAVRLVTYRPMIGMVQGLKVTRALCDVCARSHEEKDHD